MYASLFMYPPMSQLTKVRITAGAAANRAERRASGCTMTRNVNGHTVAKKAVFAESLFRM